MSMDLGSGELLRLIRAVFRPGPEDTSIALLVDLPDGALADRPEWAARRKMVVGWFRHLGDSDFATVNLALYRNVRRNNADLPATAWFHGGGALPADADEVDAGEVSFDEVLASHRILIAATELSATAPLKLLAPRFGCRAATMPGFTSAMIPALRLDYEEIHHRCLSLKERLDAAERAVIRFRTGTDEHELQLDLRHRKATASGGLVREPGTAGNLPSGETYIVPYEGERSNDPSRTRGVLPLQLDGELLLYRIERNRVVAVVGDGPRAAAERREVETEPAYANVAELGLGVLADYGIEPVGEILLDEKLGLHIAFGRSDHFGGIIGAAQFTSPDRVVHIDRVYLPQLQPAIHVSSVDLYTPTGATPLIRNGSYI